MRKTKNASCWVVKKNFSSPKTGRGDCPVLFSDLPCHVHDGDGVSAVADDDVVRVLGEDVDTVDVDVPAGRGAAQGLERVDALGGLGVPDLDRAVRRAPAINFRRHFFPRLHTLKSGLRQDVMPVDGEDCTVDVGSVAPQLL